LILFPPKMSSRFENFLDQTLNYITAKPGKKEIGIQTDEDCKSLLKKLELKKNLEIQKILKENNTQYFEMKEMKQALMKKTQELDQLENDYEDLKDKYRKIKYNYEDLYKLFHKKYIYRN
jgi:hypothetical protein